MFTNEWLQWLKRSFRRIQKGKQQKMRPRYRPLMENLEDRTLMSISVLSTAASGTGSGQSEAAPVHSVSDDGRFVVFASNASNLVSGQSTPSGQLNVFLHDNLDGTTTLVSHQYGNPTTGGICTNGYDSGSSFNPVISGDGSTIAFYSQADNLAAGEIIFPTNYVGLYVYNTATGSVTLADHNYYDANTVGGTLNPEIPTSSGNYINTSGYSTGWETVGDDVNGLAAPSLSYDGKYIAYISDANNLVWSNSGGSDELEDGGYVTNAYLYDNNPADPGFGTNAMVSHAYGNPIWSASVSPFVGAWATTVAISADGSTVAFTDPGTNLVLNQSSDGLSDQLYVWSRIDNPNTGLSAGQTVLASHTYASATTGGHNVSGWEADNPPTLSADGTAVAYYFDGNNLVSGQSGTASMLNVFRYNVATNTNDLVTHIYGNNTTAGNNPQNLLASPGNGPSEATGPQISSNGQYIAYANNSKNLLSTTLPTSQNGRDNVYLYDASTHLNTLVSNNGASTGGALVTPDTGGGTAPSLSYNPATGAVFVTFADLAYPSSGSTSGNAGVVNVRLFQYGSTTQPASIGQSFDTTAILPASGGGTAPASLSLYAHSFQPTLISADGSTIVWSGPALATSMVPGISDTNHNFDVFEGTNPNLTVTNQITSSDTLTATTGTAVSFPITTNNPPTSIAITGTLPSGLTFNSTTDTITGTPDTPTPAGVPDVVTVTANFSSGSPVTQTLSITVNSGVITSTLSNSSVTEYRPIGTTVGTLSTIDPNANQTPTYTLIGTNSTLFTITGNTLKTNTVFLSTTPVTIHIQTADSYTSNTQAFTITVSPSTTPPGSITLTNSSTTTYQPVGTLIGTFNSTDPNAGQTGETYTLSGPNSGLFSVTSTGTLVTNTVFTTAQTLPIVVTVTDSPAGLSSSTTLTITVNPTTTPPTNITLSNTTITTYEPIGTTVGTITSTDPNSGQTITYTLSGPAAGDFTINSSGQLLTNTVFTGTTTQTYSITVTATDSPAGLSSSQTFTITVNPTTSTPTNITLSNTTITTDEPIGTTVGTITSTDPNVGQTVTYTLSGPAAGDFAIDSAGNLITTTVFTGTTTQTYSITVIATDSLGLSSSQTFTITVNPTTSAPTDITLSNDTVTAYRAIGTFVGSLSSIDPNVGQTVSYSLTGSNADLFAIDSAGNLNTNTVFTTTTTESFGITVVATDTLGLSSSQTFTITVNPSTDGPVDIVLSSSAVTAYRAAGTVVGTVSVSDPNVGQSVTYTISGGDTVDFTIDSAGELKTDTIFATTVTETFTITVTATDSLGLSSSETFTITVNPSSAPPTDITLSNFSVKAYRPVGTLVGSLSSIDPNVGQTVTYSLLGANASLFTIDSAGNVKTNSVLTPATYGVTVVATDSLGLSSSQDFAITAVSTVADHLTLSADESATVGDVYGNPLVVTVYDADNYPLPGVSVTFTLPTSGPGGTLTTLTATTDVNGQVSETLTANEIAGSFTVGVNVSSGSNPSGLFHLTNLADAPASVTLSGDNQTAEVGTIYASPLITTVHDEFGNPVPDVTVTLTPPTSGAGGTLSATTGVTDANGQVSVTLTANNTAGAFTIGVSTLGGSDPTGVFHLTNVSSQPASVVLTGSGQSATVGHAYTNSLVVTVLDGLGHPVANKTVTFSRPTTGASGSLSATTGITNSSGQVTVQFTANTIAGSVTIGVAVTGGSNPTGTFHLTNTADVPTSVVVSGGGQRATVTTTFATPLVATVLDHYGNPVPGVTVKFTLPNTGAAGALSGGTTGITDANGKVTKFLTGNTKAGTYAIGVAVTGGSNPTNTITGLTNVAGVAVSMSMAFVNPPPIFYAGNQLPTISIQLLDQYGNKALSGGTRTVTITLASGKKFRGGISSVSANFNAAGTATFRGLFIDLAGSYTLQMSSTGLLANNSLSFTVKAKATNSAKAVN
jgi:Bacterial Ig-like domain (group 1)/Putative Ig domain/WD40-like Beta Propeller Repeat